MTDTTLDPFDVIRGELLRAAKRDVSRSRHRVRVLRVALVSVASLVLLTGIAAAASERVADAIHGASVDILGVVQGADEVRRPSPEAAKWNSELGIAKDPALVDLDHAKVLMDDEIDGHHVEITAFPRKAVARARDQTPSVCMSLMLDHKPSSANCGPSMRADLPANYGGSIETGPQASYIRTALWGITSSAVTGVNLVTPEGAIKAHMGDHSFWVRTEREPLALEFLLSDGTKAVQKQRSEWWACKNDPDVATAQIEKCAFSPPKGDHPTLPPPVTYARQ